MKTLNKIVYVEGIIIWFFHTSLNIYLSTNKVKGLSIFLLVHIAN
jgi:hypothetical protein